MYRPDYSVSQNDEHAMDLIREFPLGLLISTPNGKPAINYLPFSICEEGGNLYLIGHFAKANPQWKDLGSEVTVAFQGPDSYVTPKAYLNSQNVPTWSYAAVRVTGIPQIIYDREGIKKILQASVRFFEVRNGSDWAYELPDSLTEKLESAIVGIKIKIITLEAKFKFNQNRNSEDYRSLVNYLKARQSHKDNELLRWMKKASRAF